GRVAVVYAIGVGAGGEAVRCAAGFIRPFPANVHKCLVGVRPSLGDQAIALGLRIGGRVAVIHPQQVGAGLADSTLSQLCQPIVAGRHGRVPQTVVSSHTAACAGAAGARPISFSSLLKRSSNPLLSSARTSTSTTLTT